HYQGQDYPLTGLSFTLGRQPGCDLVFDAETHPDVASRHCEIRCQHQTFVLCDYSDRGTLVNEGVVETPLVLSAGDWIRLGPGGPLLRFLGNAAGARPLTTTA